MPEVQTIRGTVGADAIGTTLMHEHVFIRDDEIEHNYPGRWDEDVRVADAVIRLRAMKAVGVDTIVDLTVLGMGRDVARVARINEQVDVNIVAATGLYTYRDIPHYFDFQGPGTPLGGDDVLISMFVRDITAGIADTGIRAGVLKCAIHDALTPGVSRPFRRGRGSAPADRRADHGPHERAARNRPGRAGVRRQEGRRSREADSRAQRGLHRPGLPASPGRRRLDPGDGPVRGGHDPAYRAAGRHCRRAGGRGTGRTHGALARRRLPHGLAAGRVVGARSPELALHLHPRQGAARPPRAGRHRRAAHDHARGHPAPLPGRCER